MSHIEEISFRELGDLVLVTVGGEEFAYPSSEFLEGLVGIAQQPDVLGFSVDPIDEAGRLVVRIQRRGPKLELINGGAA